MRCYKCTSTSTRTQSLLVHRKYYTQVLNAYIHTLTTHTDTESPSTPLVLHAYIPVTDPGFPQGGGGREPSKGGREHTILPNSPKNCMKLKEFGRRGGGGVRPSRPPLRSATAYTHAPHTRTQSPNAPQVLHACIHTCTWTRCLLVQIEPLSTCSEENVLFLYLFCHKGAIFISMFLFIALSCGWITGW